MAAPAKLEIQSVEQSFLKRFGLIIGALILLGIVLIPTPEGLPIAGHRMLAILVFSVIIWMTDTISYPASAAVIMALMAFLVGISPNESDPKTIIGTAQGLRMALDGFSNTALALVGGALFIAAAMMQTGLDKRIALFVLSKIGAKTNRVLIGVILVGFILSFFVPSTTARVSCMVPIVMGIIGAFGVEHKSKFAGMMMIAVAQADSIWNVGIKTAAAQNMIALGFIEKQLGIYISWLDWFIAAVPFSIFMSVALYYVLMKMMPPETDEIAGGKEAVAKALTELGPMKSNEKKLMILSVILLGLWATEKILHPFDTSSTTIAAIAIMLLPGIGIMTWKEAQSKIPWGTLLLFGVGISLGSALLSTKAATWLAKIIVTIFGLQTMPILMILAVLSAFLIIIHLGFASATALAAAMIPIIISILQGVKTPGVNVVGMTMILQYVVSFGFILPVNAPQNMVAYGTETFEVKDFIKTGIPLTVIAYLLIMILGATYWKWLGLV
ncbi:MULTISPECIES: DASS family sodium-coupled anion symporter [Pelosinus]|uniref:Anion transporter n=1 Tax=Pelosinus fermentans B4 TaxID=1149862 RepID=I9LJE7_9FIRM|nr:MULTISPECIES: DASS family sodium-coupled anion symporter [Pelosinus]EIW20546.1 anion transporter [Pelosinus fermentans B4]EIW25739.1 anion transporter [Pelosinus fermentans A11]OAM93463.1 anion transporter [Pelosinus fermentans DSM 17108]SDQ78728.1 anion transporter [Pelosinus fermentans]